MKGLETLQLVIKIPEDTYKATCSDSMLPPHVENVVNAIKNGTPLPKGHGRLIDANNISFSQFFDAGDYAQAMRGIYNAPTIIEADKAEK